MFAYTGYTYILALRTCRLLCKSIVRTRRLCVCACLPYRRIVRTRSYARIRIAFMYALLVCTDSPCMQIAFMRELLVYANNPLMRLACACLCDTLHFLKHSLRIQTVCIYRLFTISSFKMLIIYSCSYTQAICLLYILHLT